jgi:hypothetical protein
MQKASEMKVENLDHLGLVAGLIMVANYKLLKIRCKLTSYSLFPIPYYRSSSVPHVTENRYNYFLLLDRCKKRSKVVRSGIAT